MNTLAKKAKGLFLSGIVLSLAACAHYQQPAYYPAAASYPVYGGGAVITQRSYYEAYPYSYSPAPYPVYQNYYHVHDDHHDHNPVYYLGRPGDKGRLKANPPDRYPHHPEKNFPQHGKKEPVNKYQGRTHHPDRKAQDKQWDKPHSDHPWDRRNPNPHDYGQNRKSYDRQEKNPSPNQNRREWNQSDKNRHRFNKQQDNGGQNPVKSPRNYRHKNDQRSIHDGND